MPAPTPAAATRWARCTATARELLAAADLEGVAAWAAGEPRALRVLSRLLFDPDDLTRWRAVEAVGRVAGLRARTEPERARELIRRMLWLMNDESGGVGWRAPEVIGAVLANTPALAGEYVPLLVPALSEEPFRQGSHWALWRTATACPEAVEEAAPVLAASLADADPAIRVYATLALRALGQHAEVRGLARDAASVTIFDFRRGVLTTTTPAQAAGG